MYWGEAHLNRSAEIYSPILHSLFLIHFFFRRLRFPFMPPPLCSSWRVDHPKVKEKNCKSHQTLCSFSHLFFRLFKWLLVFFCIKSIFFMLLAACTQSPHYPINVQTRCCILLEAALNGNRHRAKEVVAAAAAAATAQGKADLTTLVRITGWVVVVKSWFTP